MSIFWICVICIFIKVVAVAVAKAVYIAIEDNSGMEMVLSVGCLLALLIFSIFFYPFAIFSFYNQMILPLSPIFPQITYWQIFWIRIVAGILFSKVDYDFKEKS